MVVSMALFALADLFVKLSTEFMPPSLLALWLLAGGALVFVGIVVLQGLPLFSRVAFHPTLLGRYVAEICGAVGMISAFARVDLSTVAAILQATPLVVTMSAALFLGETVGWRRWTAIAVGFFGVLLIIQPGGAAFEPAMLWAVLGMLGLSFRDFFTRISPPELPTSILSAYTLLAALPAMLIWSLIAEGTVIPKDPNWFFMAAMVIFGTGGYFAVTLAMRDGEMSAIAPFRYTRLLFAGGLGLIFLGERPDGLAYLGTALILASGLYSLWRERRLAKALHTPGAPG